MGIDPSGRWGQPDGTAAATVTAGRRNPAVAAPPQPKEPGVGKSLRDPEGHSRIRRGAAIPGTRNTPGSCCDRPGATAVPLHRGDRLSGGWGQGSSCTPSLPSPSDNPIFEPGD